MSPALRLFVLDAGICGAGLLLFFHGLIVLGVQIRAENVERIFSSCEQKCSELWMESQFFHVVLALMKEHQLWWDLHSVCLKFLGLLLILLNH